MDANMLDWMVGLNISFYKTTIEPDYDPKCKSHFYLKGSLERFSSAELIKIFTNKMCDKLSERWNYAVEDNADFNKRH